MKKILVPIDFSPVTRRVVAEAVKLAQAMDAELVLLHVVTQPAYLGAEAVPMVDPRLMWMMEAEKHTERHLRRIEGALKKRGLHVRSLCVTGFPVTRIRAQMKQLPASLVVIGSHGHTALHDLVMGGTTSGVLKRAGCPVVVVPAAREKKRRGRKP